MEEIELQKVDKGTPLAEDLLNFVKNFSWLDVKEHTVRVLENWEFEEWETPFVAIVNGQIVGMTTIMKSDYYPLPEIFPWISTLFVSEDYRGNRISGKLIDFANQCTLAIREMFMQKTQREINDAIIEEVLCTGTASIPAADIKIILMIAKEYVDGIFRRLREHGYDEGTMMLYITGGGGCLVKNFGKVSADRVKFVDDICAAAKGYEYLAEAQLKAELGL